MIKQTNFLTESADIFGFSFWRAIHNKAVDNRENFTNKIVKNYISLH